MVAPPFAPKSVLRAPFAAPLVLALVCRVALAATIAPAGEDAYITFRYAWNWTHGLGPVFNAGERVLGVTSAPWMAWVALGLTLGVDPVVWTRVTLVGADLVTLAAFTALLSRHASRASAWCFALFFAAWPYFSGLACSGLETGAMLALVALGAWLLDRRHPLAGVALGVLAVFRPEGLLAAGVLALWARPRDRWVALALAAAAFGALALYYGSPVPQSVLAKAASYGVPGLLHATQWWDWAVPVPLAGGPSTAESSNFFTLTVIASPAAVAGALAARRHWSSPLVGAIVALSAVWLALLVTGTSYFFWYFAAPLVAWALLAAIGLPRIAGNPLVYGSLALMIAGHWLFEGELYKGRAEVESRLFGHTADALNAHARPGQSVLLEPIGVIGWRCAALTIHDDVGLVTPAATAARRAGAGWYARLVESTRPDWLVVRAGLLRGQTAFAGAHAPFQDIAEGRRTLAPYELVSVGDTTAGNQALVVFQRALPAAR